jgi:glycyl-tRNA synthetase beta subunit
MKTLRECNEEVAKRHGMGKLLVTGHLVKYFDEVAIMFADQEVKKAKIELLEGVISTYKYGILGTFITDKLKELKGAP